MGAGGRPRAWRVIGPHASGLAVAIQVALAGLLAACGSGGGAGPAAAGKRRQALEATATAAAALPAPLLPHPAGPRAPSQADLRGADGRTLADVETCGGCHPDAFAQQQASAHAQSSFNNPIYRQAVAAIRSDLGRPVSRMCAGCHDIALLADGAIDQQIDPRDPRSAAGVTCRVCHGIAEVRRDGNGSYVYKRRPIVLPRSGDAASVLAHKRSVAPLRTADMCGSCHRSFLDDSTGNRGVFLNGPDELSAWMASAYDHDDLSRIDDPVPARDCIGCHMPREAAPLGDAAARNGTIPSHRFLGGHTWMASMLGNRQQLARQAAFLRGVVSVDVAEARSHKSGRRTLPADGAPVTPGDTLTFDVVLRNLLVGHRFPGGILDAQDTWIEVAVRDANGRLLARAGGTQAQTGHDPSAHVLRALVADKKGTPRFLHETHTFRAAVVNQTIAPRDAVVERYRFHVPADLLPAALPLEVEARVMHRSRDLMMQKAACTASRSALGRAFAAAARRRGHPVLDPCASQPITKVAEATVWIGRGWKAQAAAASPAAPARPAWRRNYEHGMALLHSLQEHLEDARAPLMAALHQLDRTAGATPRDRARVLLALGQLEGTVGRVDAALDWLDRARALVPNNPAVAYARGLALARVWRWREAADAFAIAAPGAPDNPAGWTQLAVALGSLGRDREALAAAQKGLALSPRNADCLRVQSVALHSLGAPDPVSAAALAAYDAHRPPDRATDIRIACAAHDPECARERDPVHVHDLVPAPR